MKNSIKIWPFINNITQALIPYSDSHLQSNDYIYIDFTNVKQINSSGVNMTLAKLILISKNNPHYRFRIIESNDFLINDFLQKSGFYYIINGQLNIETENLFANLKISNINEPLEIFDNLYNINKISFPIYHLNFDRQNYRACVEDFSEWIVDRLEYYLYNYNFKLNVFSKILKEIAKNSEDHTGTDAYFGLDINLNSERKKGEIIFSFFDQGIGILENVRSHIYKFSNLRKTAKKHFALTDAYYQAYKVGFTTSSDERNKGIGMSMIMDGVNILNMDLSIFDAKSMGFIPTKNTHAEIRKNFWNTSNEVGFNYYGRLIF